MYNTLILGKDYPIQASTRDEMLVWISAIEEAKVRVVPIVMLPYHPFPFYVLPVYMVGLSMKALCYIT